MSLHQDGAFGASLQFASEQAQVWVPQWVSHLKEALRVHEQGARNYLEKQAMAQARSVLARYHDEVTKRFLAGIAQVLKDAGALKLEASGQRKPSAFNLDALTLLDHDAVQEKVDLTRAQQVVRMAAEDALPPVDAVLTRARGFDVVRTDVNPLHPDAIVAALSRALGSLHLDDDVRAQWMQTGAALLGAELKRFYGAMTNCLVQLGVQPADYVVVQRSENRRITAAPDPGSAEPWVAGVPQHGATSLTLEDLHGLLASTLKATVNGDTGQSGQAHGLACSLASEVVTRLMQSLAEDERLLKRVRDMVQVLRPALMQLARAQPDFFADPANPARRLLDAIALQGAVFVTELDPGFVEFADRTQRVLGALQAADSELPARMVAALQRFRGPVVAQPVRPVPAPGAHRMPAHAREQVDEVPPAFMDTLPMERDLMPVDGTYRRMSGAALALATASRPSQRQPAQGLR